MSEVLSGAEFKKQLREGVPKLGLFVNSHSPTVAEQLAHSGYDWLLVDSQHGPMGYETLVRHAGGHFERRREIAGARGRLPRSRRAFSSRSTRAPTAFWCRTSTPPKKPRQAVSCCRYPTAGTRSVYFPQRSMNKAGLCSATRARPTIT